MKLPNARNTDLVVQTLKDEVLVYDLLTNQAYCLNETAAKIFNHCDGEQTFADLNRKYKFTDEIIYLALDELQEKDLLTGEYQSPFAGVSRRAAIRKVGLASLIALPLIVGIVAPTAANAASGAIGCNAVAGVCYQKGTQLCPAGCTQTYNVNFYLNSSNGTCSGVPTVYSINCSFNPGYNAASDIRVI